MARGREGREEDTQYGEQEGGGGRGREGEGGEGMQGEGEREHKCWRNMRGIRKRRIQGNWRGLCRERRKGESWDGRNRRSW